MSRPTSKAYPNIVFLGYDPETVPPRMPKGADLPSILLVHGGPNDYVPAELDALNDLGCKLTDWYDTNVGGPRSMAHTAEFAKLDDGRWKTQKSLWTQGRNSSDTLEEGIAFILEEGYGIGSAPTPTI
jgi:hypothetical protein